MIEESKKNSFKELEQIQEEDYKDNLDKVKRSMDGNLNSIGSFVNIVDLYFSKVMSYFVTMFGGESQEDEPET